MKTIVTIIRERRFPGETYSATVKTGTREYFDIDAGHDSAEAAAKAVELAIRHGHAADGAYIFGPEKVLSHIPLEFRNMSGTAR